MNLIDVAVYLRAQLETRVFADSALAVLFITDESYCIDALQGTVRSTLSKMKDATASRSHELVEEMLSLQETLDTLLHSLTERTEENASLTIDVSHAASSL